MIVLIRVGNYLTYRVSSSVSSIISDFSNYSPDFEIILTRDLSYYCIDIITKLIDPKLVYKKGWYFNVPEVISIFRDFNKSPNDFFNAEFGKIITGRLEEFMGRYLIDNTSLRMLYKEDISSIRTEISQNLPDIISTSEINKLVFKVDYFMSINFYIGNILIEIVNEYNPEGIDPLLYSAHNLIKLVYSSSSQEKEEVLYALKYIKNPYLIIDIDKKIIEIDKEKESIHLSTISAIKQNIAEIKLKRMK